MDDFNRQNDGFCRWEIMYNNPNDLAIWVEKCTVLGWTLNFAHKEAWLIIFMILVVPIAFLIFTVFG